jgi:hypothetical protein
VTIEDGFTPKRVRGLPRCTTEAMNLHLAEIARAVTAGAHAVLLLDQAGWHMTQKLIVPANITRLPLPARSPELNPVENLWQFIRENWLVKTGSLRHTRPSSISAATPGTSLWTSPGASCPSACGPGLMGSDQ